jgi:hypothetical protein
MQNKAFIEQKTTFEPPPLQDARAQIRLLRILGSCEDDDLDEDRDTIVKCEMSVHQLWEVQSKYTAVSYTWGSENPTKAIEINGRPFTVRMNCWFALRQLWRHNGSQYDETVHAETAPARGLADLVWIDSICIDQRNTIEKMEQVSQMGRIYSSANLVAVSLRGLSAPNETGTGSHKVIRPIDQALLDCPYWERVWTVQEFVLARRLVFFYDKTMTSRESARQMVSDKTDAKSLFSPLGLTKIWLLRESSRLRAWIPFPPAQAILQFQYRKCSNPHDCLYGLLGLMSDVYRAEIEVDYAKPLLHVVLDYIRIYNALTNFQGQHLRHESSTVEHSRLDGDLMEVLQSIHGLQYAMFANASVPAIGENPFQAPDPIPAAFEERDIEVTIHLRAFCTLLDNPTSVSNTEFEGRVPNYAMAMGQVPRHELRKETDVVDWRFAGPYQSHDSDNSVDHAPIEDLRWLVLALPLQTQSGDIIAMWEWEHPYRSILRAAFEREFLVLRPTPRVEGKLEIVDYAGPLNDLDDEQQQARLARNHGNVASLRFGGEGGDTIVLRFGVSATDLLTCGMELVGNSPERERYHVEAILRCAFKSSQTTWTRVESRLRAR